MNNLKQSCLKPLSFDRRTEYSLNHLRKSMSDFFPSQACVLISHFPVKSLWLTLFTLVSFDYLLIALHVTLLILSQGFSALSFLRSFFSRSWHNIWQIFPIFWSCSSLPTLVKNSILIYRVPWLILWILLNKNSMTIFRNHVILITEVWYPPLCLMEYEVFLYHCNNSKVFWTIWPPVLPVLPAVRAIQN